MVIENAYLKIDQLGLGTKVVFNQICSGRAVCGGKQRCAVP